MPRQAAPASTHPPQWGATTAWNALANTGPGAIPGPYETIGRHQLPGIRNINKFDSLEDLPEALRARGVTPWSVPGGDLLMVPVSVAFRVLSVPSRHLTLCGPPLDMWNVGEGPSEVGILRYAATSGLWSALYGSTDFVDCGGTTPRPDTILYRIEDHEVVGKPTAIQVDIDQRSYSSQTVIIGEAKRTPGHAGKSCALRQIFLPWVAFKASHPEFNLKAVFVHARSFIDLDVYEFSWPTSQLDDARIVSSTRVRIVPAARDCV